MAVGSVVAMLAFGIENATIIRVSYHYLTAHSLQNSKFLN